MVVAVCYKFVFLIAILSSELFFSIIVMNIKLDIKVLRYLKMQVICKKNKKEKKNV